MAVIVGSGLAYCLATGLLELGSVGTGLCLSLCHRHAKPLKSDFLRQSLIACFTFFWKPNLSPRACFAEEHSCD